MLVKLAKATKKFFFKLGIICLILFFVCLFGNIKFGGILLKPKDFICFAIFTAVIFALAYLAQIIDFFKSDKDKKVKGKVKKTCIEHKEAVCFVLKAFSYLFGFFASINAIIGMVRWFAPGFAPGFGKVSLFAIIVFLLLCIGSYILSNYLALCEYEEEDEDDEDEDDDDAEEDLEDLEDEEEEPKRTEKPKAKKPTRMVDKYPEFMIVDLDEEDLPNPRYYGNKPGRYVTDEELKEMLLDAYKKGRNSK